MSDLVIYTAMTARRTPVGLARGYVLSLVDPRQFDEKTLARVQALASVDAEIVTLTATD